MAILASQCSLSDTERSEGDLSTFRGNGKGKKASVPASILLESLKAALEFICHDCDFVVREIRRSRKERLADFKEVVLSGRSNGASDRAKSSGGQWYSGSSRKDVINSQSIIKEGGAACGIKEGQGLTLLKQQSSWCSQWECWSFRQPSFCMLVLVYQARIKSRKDGYFSATIAGGVDPSHSEKVADNTYLYLVQDQKPIAIGQSKGDDIRKTDDRAGSNISVSGVHSESDLAQEES